MAAATPYATTPYSISAEEINSIYGKSNANITSSANAGQSGSSGVFGGFGALPGYNTPQFQATGYTVPLGPDGKPIYKGLAASQAGVYANIGGQLAQWGQGENAARGTAILAGMDQRIANNRTLADQNNSLYADIAGVARDTRDRNLARIDQYGNSFRQELEQNRQRELARGTRSAISRGLSNSTIRDSLSRGTNYDYGRQRINLEDSLLQNRIGTDTALSGNYQNMLQGRVGQNNQNIGYENQLTGDRLGFLAGIENPYPTYADVSNYGLQAGVLQETGASRG